MTYKTVLGAAGSVLTLVGYAPYLRNTLVGRTRPHAFSWLVWGSITAIAFAADAETLRAWLSAHHATSPGVWLALTKRAA